MNATRFQTVRAAVTKADVLPGDACIPARLARHGVAALEVEFRGFARVVPPPEPVAVVRAAPDEEGRGVAALDPLTPVGDTGLRLTFHHADAAALFAALWQSEWGRVWAADAALESVLDRSLPVEPADQVAELARAAERMRTLCHVIPPMEAIQKQSDWLAAQNHRAVAPLSEIPWLGWTPGGGTRFVPSEVTVEWPPGREPPPEPLDEHGDDSEAAECAPVPGGITLRVGDAGAFTAPTVPAARYLEWVLQSADGTWSNDPALWMPALTMPPATEDCWFVLEDKDHQLAHLLAFRRRRAATDRFINEMAAWLMG